MNRNRVAVGHFVDRLPDLQAKLDAVCDEETFIGLVTALALDREVETAKEKASLSTPCSPGANG